MSNDTVVVTLQQIAIQRSSEVTITDSFFEHEVPILELIHGEDNITVLNDDYHAIELPNNGAQEYQRLVTKYGDKYRPIVDQVFPRGIADVAKELGMVQGRDTFSKQSEAVVESRLPARPGQKGRQQSANAAQAGGTADVSEEQPELSHAELREELTRLGVEHKGNAPKAELQALYDAAQAGAHGTLGG
ncbi:hypothetical protein BCL79_0621 [Stenotrophomonas rhizophila]|uniref:HeH/LEM domain-containing protein n=1 Tax=Stenotrophomonas rhizophila TaxID=216778 RepID=A0A498CDU0_9GAMM|nr:hypothetical protein [Stenotrophomonas rhizophila]RLK56238.1 hypothetical protein BCL79_0621 [Stenotrophomonas rhizophila]